MVHIAELKVKLKASMTLISSKLEPNLVLRNDFVPRESCLCPKAVIVLNDSTDFKFTYFLHTVYASPPDPILLLSGLEHTQMAPHKSLHHLYPVFL